MRITVRLFALQRAQTGLRAYELELPDGADVAAAWTALVTELPVVAGAEGSARFARNGTYVDTSEPLADGDELAVIPPVAGGAEASGESFRHLEIREASLDDGLLEELREAVATPADGAVAMFIGQTRESPGTPAPGQEAEAARFAGQHVSGLMYEAFEPMALSVLAEIADEIETRFDVRRLAIVHRVGEVMVGESSVVIVTAAPHRGEAFEACRYAIDELKDRAPIWKAERFVGGDVWMGSPARSGPIV
ncbi:MAG: molybdenum cofactor biosynthesis protein MoaE [Chloroflexota bacterium]|nr:molybdenum cofactor biosynthesis protein MoaE [Chloroflexota bacterium]